MNPAAPVTKTARHARIAAILAREQVHSQEELAELLERYASVHVTQATLSRDLDELGVVRLRATGGALVYALPEEPGGPGSRPGGAIGGSVAPKPQNPSQPQNPSSPRIPRTTSNPKTPKTPSTPKTSRALRTRRSSQTTTGRPDSGRTRQSRLATRGWRDTWLS